MLQGSRKIVSDIHTGIKWLQVRLGDRHPTFTGFGLNHLDPVIANLNEQGFLDALAPGIP